jgi:hypothetical protein
VAVLSTIAPARGAPPQSTAVPPPVTTEETPLPAVAGSLIGFGLVLPGAWLAAQTRRLPRLAMTLGLVTLSAGVAIAVASAWAWAQAPAQGTAASATAAYLPTGIANVLFAPFPWAIRRVLDLLTIPGMVLWYLLLAFAIKTLVTDTRRWQVLPIVGFVVSVVVAFVLFEGNVGTLLRHRSMTIGSAVAVLAAPSLVALFDRLVVVRHTRQLRATLTPPPGRGQEVVFNPSRSTAMAPESLETERPR